MKKIVDITDFKPFVATRGKYKGSESIVRQTLMVDNWNWIIIYDSRKSIDDEKGFMNEPRFYGNLKTVLPTARTLFEENDLVSYKKFVGRLVSKIVELLNIAPIAIPSIDTPEQQAEFGQSLDKTYALSFTSMEHPPKVKTRLFANSGDEDEAEVDDE